MRKEQPVAKWVHQRQVGAMMAFWLVLCFDPTRYAESGGGGDFNSPRNGPKTPEGSRSLRRQQQQVQEDEIL